MKYSYRKNRQRLYLYIYHIYPIHIVYTLRWWFHLGSAYLHIRNIYMDKWYPFVKTIDHKPWLLAFTLDALAEMDPTKRAVVGCDWGMRWPVAASDMSARLWPERLVIVEALDGRTSPMAETIRIQKNVLLQTILRKNRARVSGSWKANIRFSPNMVVVGLFVK